MQDKLIIKNFLGIDYLEIELKKLNILIGAQASGKSTIAKLFYYFNGISEDIQDCVRQELFKNNSKKINFIEMQISRFISLFGKELSDKDFEITYFFSNKYDVKLSYNDNDKSYILSYSNELKNLLDSIINEHTKQVIDIVSNNKNTFLAVQLMNDISDSIYQDFVEKGIHLKQQIFIPAGRSYVATLPKNIFNLINSEELNIDLVFKRFNVVYQAATLITKHHQLSNQDLFETIVKAKYNIDDDGEFLIHPDGRKVSMARTSSGQQEALPILLIIQHILENKIKQDNGLILYIEEPEAHLFPTAQKDLVHLFARLCNHLQSDDCHIFITTHSPYLLTSFNTLLTAGSIVRQKPEKAEQVYQVIPKEEILLSNEVGAYSLVKGELKSLIDAEEELILADVLDEVSGIIADEFDKLLDLKYDD